MPKGRSRKNEQCCLHDSGLPQRGEATGGGRSDTAEVKLHTQVLRHSQCGTQPQNLSLLSGPIEEHRHSSQEQGSLQEPMIALSAISVGLHR